MRVASCGLRVAGCGLRVAGCKGVNMKLSKHFIDRWEERVKKPLPTTEEIQGMVNDSLFLQRSRDFFTARGRPVKILALYWVVDENIILKVDEKTATAVTVLTPDMTGEEVA